MQYHLSGTDEDFEEHFLNFGSSFSMREGYNMWVNGKVHQNEYSDLLHGDGDISGTLCDRDECKRNTGKIWMKVQFSVRFKSNMLAPRKEKSEWLVMHDQNPSECTNVLIRSFPINKIEVVLS